MFQQDSAPAHRARETIKPLQRETPAFISPNLWPPNSPDLNPVNYKICGVMQDCVARGGHFEYLIVIDCISYLGYGS